MNLNLSVFWTLVVLAIGTPFLVVLFLAALLAVGGGFPEM